MRNYRVAVLSEDADGEIVFVYWFDCQADNADHACEQAEDALTEGEFLGLALHITA